MRILVTGAAGFMGSWLVDELIKRGYEVIGIDDLSGGYLRNVNKKSKFIKMDLRNFKKLNSIVKKVDIIYHLAAYAAEGQSIFSPIEINDINITPMNNILVSAVNNNVEKVVFTSSMAVYGSQTPPFNEEMLRLPDDPYGCAKAYCERMLEIFCNAFGLKYVIIRPHNIYGPRQNILDPYRNVLCIWINRVMNKKPPYIYGDGNQTRAFSYIEDITPALANAGFFKKAENHIINLGSDEIVTINKACRTVLEIMNSDIEPVHTEERPCEVKYAYSTTGKSEKLLDYKTNHRFKEGVEKMVEWARKIGPQKPTYTLPLEITKRAPSVWLEQLV